MQVFGYTRRGGLPSIRIGSRRLTIAVYRWSDDCRGGSAEGSPVKRWPRSGAEGNGTRVLHPWKAAEVDRLGLGHKRSRSQGDFGLGPMDPAPTPETTPSEPFALGFGAPRPNCGDFCNRPLKRRWLWTRMKKLAPSSCPLRSQEPVAKYRAKIGV